MGDRIGEIRNNLLNDPAGLALKGYCDRVPGYLRGNAFDDYQLGRWHSQRRWIGRSGQRFRASLARRLSNALEPLSQDASLSRDRFSLNPWGEPNDASPSIVGTIEIYGEPDRGPQVFYPSNAIWIEAKGERLGITPHRLIDRGLDTTEPWVVGVAPQPIEEPLSSMGRGLMLWVDPEIRPTVELVAKRVAANEPTAQAKAAKIAEYFQSNYTYTLDTEQAPSNLDPIVHFLSTEHPAHCELFAASAALMLRTLDVPTRYVTGYVMDELSSSEDYYVARNRDAHAWVEYYDEDSRHWLSLETTPGRTFETIDEQSEVFVNAQNAGSDKDVSFIKSGWLEGFFGYFASLRFTDTLSVIFQTFQLPLLFALVGWLWWRNRGKKDDEVERKLARERRRMDRRWKRRGWVRRSSETLHQFAERLQSVPNDHPRFAELQSASTWYRQHAVEIYNGREF